MTTLSPIQLADLLSPLWHAVPEAFPKYRGFLLSVGSRGFFQFYPLGYERIDDGCARDLILARLQMAIEKRVASIDHGWLVTEQLPDGSTVLTVKRMDSTTVAVGHHPDPIVARAQLLAKIVGVVIHLPETPERAPVLATGTTQ